MKYLIAMGATLLALPASGETLQDALGDAYRNNPTVETAKLDTEIANEQLAFARAQRRPNLTTNFGVQYESVSSDRGVFAVGLGNNLIYSAQAQATLPIYTGGRISSGIDQAKAGIRASRSNLITTAQSIFLQTTDAYVTHLRDLEQVRIRETNVAVLEDQAEAARARFEVGDVTRTDVAQSEARLQRARANLALARSAREGSRARFVELVGREPSDLAPPPPAPQLPESFEAALDIALENNPAIETLKHQEDAAVAAISAAKSTRKPQVNLVATAAQQNTHYSNNFQDNSASIAGQVSIPIYQGGAASSQIRQARLERDRARLQTTETRNAIVSSLSSAWAIWLASLDAIEASREQVAAAEVAFEGAEIELDVGLRTTLELLDQEQELLEARLSVVSAERDAYVAAHQVLALMGRMTPDTLGVNLPLYNATTYEGTIGNH